MKREPVKIGVLGCGGIFGAHMRGYSQLDDQCEIVAVAEPDRGRHDRIKKWFGPDVRIFDDYAEVLNVDDIAGVDIVLPHDLHMPATIAAAKAGKHVLVEKVMARNVWECDRMIEACDDAGVTLTVAHDRRYHGEWEALKSIVDSGVLGEIFFWKLDHNQNVLPPPGHWIRTRDGIGGGAIMSCLTHQIDGLRWYAGEVEEVNAMTKVVPERMEGEFLGLVSARTRSGALVELSINWWTRSNQGANALWYEMVHVCGMKGEAYRMSGRGTFIKLHDEANADALALYGREALEDFVAVPAPDHGGHEKCVVEWVKRVRGEPADIRTDGTDCRGTVEVAEAAYLSEREGRRVSLPIEPRPWESQSDPEMIKRQLTNPAKSADDEKNPDNPLS